MRITRLFTEESLSPYTAFEFRKTSSEIKNPDGSTVFSLDEMEVPSDWTQVACDVLAQKYFRKAGVPKRLKAVNEPDVPGWLWRRIPDEDALSNLEDTEKFGGETSAKEVFDRLSGTWTASLCQYPV